MKRAQFDVARKTIYWMIAGIVITLVVIAFAFTLGSYRNKLTQVAPELRAELLSLRIVHNPYCFVWIDKFGVVHEGIIDLTKFTSAQMDLCYAPEKERGFQDFNFRLRLEQRGVEVMSNNYFHKDDFTLFKEVLVRDSQGVVIKDRLIIYVEEKI